MPESEAEVEAVKAATRRFNARKGNFTLAENHLAGLIAKAEDLDSYSGTSISQMELGLNKLYDRFDELETMATQLTDLIADQELTDDFDPGEETNRVWGELGGFQKKFDTIKLKAITAIHDLEGGQNRPVGGGGAAGAAGGAGCTSFCRNVSAERPANWARPICRRPFCLISR